jgi:Uma2 family endonuclease
MNRVHRLKDLPVIADDMPVMYEDEGQENKGESEVHTDCIDIIKHGLREFFASRPNFHVFSNINVYYHLLDHWAYISPDTMVVELPEPLESRLLSYRIGRDGPVPQIMVEVLSRRSAQQQDLTNKPILYAQLRVAEYILVDVTGNFMPQRLLLKRWRNDETWRDEQDPDGGITSRYGFRLAIDKDGDVRVIDTTTGRRFLRPGEKSAALARAEELEQKLLEAEEKLARLQKKPKR